MKVFSLALYSEPRWTGAAWLESDSWHGALLLSKQNKEETTRQQKKKKRFPPREAGRCSALNAEASFKTNEFRTLTSYLSGNAAQFLN